MTKTKDKGKDRKEEGMGRIWGGKGGKGEMARDRNYKCIYSEKSESVLRDVRG